MRWHLDDCNMATHQAPRPRSTAPFPLICVASARRLPHLPQFPVFSAGAYPFFTFVSVLQHIGHASDRHENWPTVWHARELIPWKWSPTRLLADDIRTLEIVFHVFCLWIWSTTKRTSFFGGPRCQHVLGSLTHGCRLGNIQPHAGHLSLGDSHIAENHPQASWASRRGFMLELPTGNLHR